MSCPACARRSLSRASVLLGVLAAAQAPPRPPNALTPHVIDPALWRPIDRPDEPRVRPLAISTGQALSLRQDPTVLLARDDHGIRLRNFTVAGDVDLWARRETQRAWVRYCPDGFLLAAAVAATCTCSRRRRDICALL